MSEQFDSSRPIYAQLVERLKARILAGTYQPGGHLDLDNLAGLPAHKGTADRGVAGHFAGFQIHLVMADNGVAHLHPARKIGECHPAKQ